jgi:hypothetical protein
MRRGWGALVAELEAAHGGGEAELPDEPGRGLLAAVVVADVRLSMVGGDEGLVGAIEAVAVVAVRGGRHVLQLYRRHDGQTGMAIDVWVLSRRRAER